MIVITGPTGSGKSFLCNKLSKLFINSIVIRTDSYYRDNVLIRFLSTFIYDIYDRPISLKKKYISNTLRSIHNRDRLIKTYNYDFTRRRSKVSKIDINYNHDKQFLILEGIFAHRLKIDYKKTINIVCNEEKKICYERRLVRDQLERGRNIKDVNKKFNQSWYLFHHNVKSFLTDYKVLKINPLDNITYDKLIYNLKKN
tara:strand:+ start:638 stop:1234 length:597 start_codon:yes stop_codon:yes gene_type:complete